MQLKPPRVCGPMILATDAGGHQVAFRADAVMASCPAIDKDGRTPVLGCIGVMLNNGATLALKASAEDVAKCVREAHYRTIMAAGAAQAGQAFSADDDTDKLDPTP